MRQPFTIPTVDALRAAGFDPDRDTMELFWSHEAGWAITIDDKRLDWVAAFQLTTPIDWRAEAALLRGDAGSPDGWGYVADHTVPGPIYERIAETGRGRHSLTVRITMGGAVEWEVDRWADGWVPVRYGADPDRSTLRAMATAEQLLPAP